MFRKVDASEFLELKDKLKNGDKNLSDFDLSEAQTISWYVNKNNTAGYGVTRDNEIVNLFSVEKGQGTEGIKDAIRRGGHWLNCFDTFLTLFYSRHGFREFKRLPNWTKGEPDVVWMQLQF